MGTVISQEQEQKLADQLVEVLGPCLKKNKKGRYETTGGDKTALGLYRTIQRIVDGEY